MIIKKNKKRGIITTEKMNILDVKINIDTEMQTSKYIKSEM